jgi:hypothetical protein
MTSSLPCKLMSYNNIHRNGSTASRSGILPKARVPLLT